MSAVLDGTGQFTLPPIARGYVVSGWHGLVQAPTSHAEIDPDGWVVLVLDDAAAAEWDEVAL